MNALMEKPEVALAAIEYDKAYNFQMRSDPDTATLAGRSVASGLLTQKYGYKDVDAEIAAIEEFRKRKQPTQPPAQNLGGSAQAPRENASSTPQAKSWYTSVIQALFDSTDTVCVMQIVEGGAKKHFFNARDPFLTEQAFDYFKEQNQTASIYVAMNPFKDELRGADKGRTEENVAKIKRLYADADDNGVEAFNKLKVSTTLPQPHIVLETSPGKYQFIWNVDGLDQPTAKRMLKAIASELGTDPAVAETARVFRLPGFVNRKKKYTGEPIVKLVGDILNHAPYRPEDFKLSLNAAPAEAAKPKAEEWLNDPFIHGQLDNQIVRLIGHYVTSKNISDADEMYALVTAKMEANGCVDRGGKTPYQWNDARVRELCQLKTKNWKTGEEQKQEAITEALAEGAKVGEAALVAAQTLPLVQPSTLIMSNAQPQPAVPEPAASASAVATLLTDDDPNWQYAITPEEREEQMQNEFPVIPLKVGPGPSWDDDIMYGVVGEIVRKIAVYNEAHPAGIYLDFLVSLGNIIGYDPYFNITSTRHGTNEFLVRVGDSSKSRKGTGREEVNRVASMIDPRWYAECITSGFGSSEAIIHKIRDDAVKQVRKQRSNAFESVLVPGISDKRLMIREGELASVYQLAGKRDSRADIVLRDGWDSVPLHNTVKGNTNGINNSASVQRPHISISADTTRHELLAKMPPGADSNGFGNRFLYCHVQRVKMCPQGGPIPDLIDEVERLGRAIALARGAGCVGLSTAARKLWSRMYQKLEEESSIGSTLACSMMARGPAHVRRIALILCLLDEPEALGGFQVEVEHLRAAKDIWDYCAESTRFIFGGLTREQIAIHDWLQKAGPKTVSEITQQLFHKNRKVEWVRHQVNALIGANKATLDGEKITAK